MPILSIIIPVKNDLTNFKKTISSLRFTSDIEVIVVDGNSNDGLHEYICSSGLNKKIKLVNQRSKGIYQGFNEGLFNSEGEYVTYLCCGDEYNSNLAVDLIGSSNATVVAASCAFIENGKETSYIRSKIKKIQPDNMSILHGSLIVKRSAYISINGFDENFRVSADVDAIHKILKSGSIIYSDKIIVKQIPYGVSNQLYFTKIFEHSRILWKSNLYLGSLFYIPKRLVKDYIILVVWKMIKKWT